MSQFPRYLYVTITIFFATCTLWVLAHLPEGLLAFLAFLASLAVITLLLVAVGWGIRKIWHRWGWQPIIVIAGPTLCLPAVCTIWIRMSEGALTFVGILALLGIVLAVLTAASWGFLAIRRRWGLRPFIVASVLMLCALPLTYYLISPLNKNNQMNALLEAERRGTLPPEKLPMLQEARRRGLIPYPALSNAGNLPPGFVLGPAPVASRVPIPPGYSPMPKSETGPFSHLPKAACTDPYQAYASPVGPSYIVGSSNGGSLPFSETESLAQVADALRKQCGAGQLIWQVSPNNVQR